MDLQKIRELVSKAPVDFQEQMEWYVKRNGKSEKTLIFQYQDSQFIFIEGQKNVTLGWSADDDVSEMIPTLKQEYTEMQEYYETELQDIKEYYAQEIQKATEKGDLEKVETLQEDAEEDIACTTESLEAYADADAYIQAFRKHIDSVTSPVRVVNIPNLLVEVDNQFLEQDMTWEEVKASLSETPFRLPTEDEWEYLCCGGERICFKWGNTLSEDILHEMYGVGTATHAEEHGEMQYLPLPSNQGVFIAYDSYEVELVEQKGIGKGGDGGCMICGGSDALYVAPCYSCFFRDTLTEGKYSKNYYKIRRVLPLYA